MQKLLAGLFALLAIPVMIFNLLGGMVSGLWLAYLGEWKIIGIGILSLFITSTLLAFALLPQVALTIPVMMLVERDKKVAAAVAAIPVAVYGIVIMVGWSYFIFLKANAVASESNQLPVLIWSYMIATGPWTYMAGQESKAGGGELSLIYAAFIEVALK